MAWFRGALRGVEQQIGAEESETHPTARVRSAVTRLFTYVAITPVVNSETMCELLRKIAAPGLYGPITLVLDIARYQNTAFADSQAAVQITVDHLVTIPAPQLATLMQLNFQKLHNVLLLAG